jgi:hypothetical protein
LHHTKGTTIPVTQTMLLCCSQENRFAEEHTPWLIP